MTALAAASSCTSQVRKMAAATPTSPTQKLNSMTMRRSEPIPTPSARSEANSLMLAMMAPRRVCQVMATPMMVPSTTQPPMMITRMPSSNMPAALASASSLRVQARHWPSPMVFSSRATASALAGSRNLTISGPTRGPVSACPTMRRVSRDMITVGCIMFG